MLGEVVEQVKKTAQNVLNNAHTACPGTIVSFDPATGLATVLPTLQFEKPDGTTLDFPQISGVPVCIPQGSGQSATIAFPVKPGDGCLIVFAEQSLDRWLYGRRTDTNLRFDLSNAMCIPGMFPRGNTALATACAQDAVVVQKGSVILAVGAEGVTVTGDLTVTGKITAQSDVAVSGKITGSSELSVSGKITGGGDISASGKITSGGDTVASGKSLKSHTHTDSMGGSTSAPN